MQNLCEFNLHIHLVTYIIASFFQTQNKKEAEKIVKNIIKIVTKISFLARNDQFSKEEMVVARDFQTKFHKSAKTLISFYEVDFSYDQKYLVQVSYIS